MKTMTYGTILMAISVSCKFKCRSRFFFAMVKGQVRFGQRSTAALRGQRKLGPQDLGGAEVGWPPEIAWRHLYVKLPSLSLVKRMLHYFHNTVRP